MNKITLKEVLIWLSIFIIGSLIVSWILGGGLSNTYHNIKDNLLEQRQEIKNTQYVEDTKIKNSEDTKVENLVKTTYQEPTPPKEKYKEVYLEYWNSCSGLEYSAEVDGVSKRSIKETYCKSLCGQNNLEYGYYDCRTDKIYCYCLI